MGPSRFEHESEDPQSPRMPRLPYGPALYYSFIFHMYLIVREHNFGPHATGIINCFS